MGKRRIPEILRGMSEANVEMIRKAFEAWNAGDMDAVRDVYDPDVIMRAPPDWPEPGPFVGRDAVMQQFIQAREAFSRDSVQVVSDFQTAGDRVIVRTDWRGTGSGPQSDIEWTVVFTIRNGRVFHVEYFWDHSDALNAAGLSE
jgi:ketosteroid isomerase-like protein